MLKFYDREFSSRLLIGSALYPSPAIMQAAIQASGAPDRHGGAAVGRAPAAKTGDAFWSLIRELDVTVLPNTARLPERARGRDHREAGARIVRDALGSSSR